MLHTFANIGTDTLSHVHQRIPMIVINDKSIFVLFGRSLATSALLKPL